MDVGGHDVNAIPVRQSKCVAAATITHKKIAFFGTPPPPFIFQFFLLRTCKL